MSNGVRFKQWHALIYRMFEIIYFCLNTGYSWAYFESKSEFKTHKEMAVTLVEDNLWMVYLLYTLPIWNCLLVYFSTTILVCTLFFLIICVTRSTLNCLNLTELANAVEEFSSNAPESLMDVMTQFSLYYTCTVFTVFQCNLITESYWF